MISTGPLLRLRALCSLSVFGKDTKLIYRHYATLYFVFAVDQAESELGILDLIHVFVEVRYGRIVMGARRAL